MKILLYGINYSPELTGIGKYSGEMARWLAQHGHEVRVVTAPPYYPEWKVPAGYRRLWWQSRSEDGIEVTRCPLYVPRAPGTLARLLHLKSFAASSFLALMTHWRWHPDVLILVAPTLFCAPGALLFCGLSGCRSHVHIQDFEVDALFGLGLGGAGKAQWLHRLAYACERLLLRRFDGLSTISDSMLTRAQSKGVAPEKLTLFPNWSETERFQNVPRSPQLLRRLAVPERKKLVLYAGNIGRKQGFEQLIEAAEQLQKREELFFLIVGDGAGKQDLLDMVAARTLRNTGFAPLQAYEDLPVLLASADIHLVIQKRGAADAVLPSKLTNILAVGGNAIITADVDTSLGKLCQDFPGIAVLCEPESTPALIAAIEQSLDLPLNNQVARRYALERLDKDAILSGFVEQLETAVLGAANPKATV